MTWFKFNKKEHVVKLFVTVTVTVPVKASLVLTFLFAGVSSSTLALVLTNKNLPTTVEAEYPTQPHEVPVQDSICIT